MKSFSSTPQQSSQPPFDLEYLFQIPGTFRVFLTGRSPKGLHTNDTCLSPSEHRKIGGGEGGEREMKYPYNLSILFMNYKETVKN